MSIPRTGCLFSRSALDRWFICFDLLLQRHRLLHNGYLSRLQGLTRSVNDIPTCLASSTSSSSADELSSDELQVSPLDGVKGQREGKQKKRLTQDDQRKHLLNKMRREKERIEKALELKVGTTLLRIYLLLIESELIILEWVPLQGNWCDNPSSILPISRNSY